MVAQTLKNREDLPRDGLDGDRVRMLAELRARYLKGTLDDVLMVSDEGIDRLLRDLLAFEAHERSE